MRAILREEAELNTEVCIAPEVLGKRQGFAYKIGDFRGRIAGKRNNKKRGLEICVKLESGSTIWLPRDKVFVYTYGDERQDKMCNLQRTSLSSFQRDLRDLINRYSLENRSNTADRVLARFLTSCLFVFEEAVAERSATSEEIVARSMAGKAVKSKRAALKNPTKASKAKKVTKRK